MTKAYYKNRLPHIAPIGAEFFITFRLFDSLPLSVIQTLKDELNSSVQKLKSKKPNNYKYQINKLKYEFSYKYDKFLDQNSHGKCYLKNDQVAQVVAKKLHQFDKEYYELEAYTIMPNHIHLLIDTSIQLENEDIGCESSYIQLHKIMQLIKGASAFEANKILGKKGKFWMKDSYDHYIRNEIEWDNVLEYIINNPVDAGLVNNWNDWKFTYCKYF